MNRQVHDSCYRILNLQFSFFTSRDMKVKAASLLPPPWKTSLETDVVQRPSWRRLASSATLCSRQTKLKVNDFAHIHKNPTDLIVENSTMVKSFLAEITQPV